MGGCRGLLTHALVCCVVVAWSQHCTVWGDEGTEATQLRKIPDFIQVCHRNDPLINDCVTKTVEIIRPHLVKGIEELDVPSIEPLLLKEILAVQGGGVRIRATQVKAFGCSDFDIHSLNMDLASNEISFVLDFPMLYIDAQYEVDGRVILLPVYGSGPLKANYTECRAAVTLQTAVVERSERTFFHVKNFHVKIEIGGGSIFLKNLFGGDPLLGSVVNSVLNSNFQTLTREMIPSIESALSDIMLEIANNVVSKFTYDQLLPLL